MDDENGDGDGEGWPAAAYEAIRLFDKRKMRQRNRWSSASLRRMVQPGPAALNSSPLIFFLFSILHCEWPALAIYHRRSLVSNSPSRSLFPGPADLPRHHCRTVSVQRTLTESYRGRRHSATTPGTIEPRQTWKFLITIDGQNRPKSGARNSAQTMPTGCVCVCVAQKCAYTRRRWTALSWQPATESPLERVLRLMRRSTRNLILAPQPPPDHTKGDHLVAVPNLAWTKDEHHTLIQAREASQREQSEHTLSICFVCISSFARCPEISKLSWL